MYPHYSALIYALYSVLIYALSGVYLQKVRVDTHYSALIYALCTVYLQRVHGVSATVDSTTGPPCPLAAAYMRSIV